MSPKRNSSHEAEEENKKQPVKKTIGKRGRPRKNPPPSTSESSFDSESIVKIPDILAELNHPELIKKTEEEKELEQWINGETNNIPFFMRGTTNKTVEGKTQMLMRHLAIKTMQQALKTQSFIEACQERLFVQERLDLMTNMQREQALLIARADQSKALDSVLAMSTYLNKKSEEIPVTDPAVEVQREFAAIDNNDITELLTLVKTGLQFDQNNNNNNNDDTNTIQAEVIKSSNNSEEK